MSTIIRTASRTNPETFRTRRLDQIFRSRYSLPLADLKPHGAVIFPLRKEQMAVF